MRALRFFVPVGIVSSLAACGLERPIAPQPLVSVIDEWRQSMLAENSQWLSGKTLEVPTAEVSGDFGKLRWDDPMSAEANAVEGDTMISVDLLAGGGDGRWGMTILGIYLPAFDDLQPGVTKRVAPFEASVIGCTGVRLNDWDIDQSADVTTIDAELDRDDPDLVHLTFTGDFADGTTLSGRFTIERPASSTAP